MCSLGEKKCLHLLFVGEVRKESYDEFYKIKQGVGKAKRAAFYPVP